MNNVLLFRKYWPETLKAVTHMIAEEVKENPKIVKKS